MNVVKIYGGLGNQILQYSFGKAQSLATGVEVGYDLSWYDNLLNSSKAQFPRIYRLNKFYTQVYVHPYVGGQRLIKEVDRRRVRLGFDLALLKCRDVNFEGYWQYLGYHLTTLPILRIEMKVRENFYTGEFLKLREKILSCNSVGVHVRRGDYLLHRRGAFRDLPYEYYQKAIGLTQGDLFIFSDDITWCKRQFRKEYYKRDITFVCLEDYLDFELFKFCKTKVITNSTFSYTSALLSEDPNQKVIAPTHWLGDGLEKGEHYPVEWIKSKDYANY